MPIDDGGYAFPQSDTPVTGSERGMSLRDYFAGQALAGYLAKMPILVEQDPNGCLPNERQVSRAIGDETMRGVVNICYRYADALQAERKKADAPPR